MATHTILVVDDDETMRRVICGFLQQCGYEVIVADSGEGALDTFKVYRTAFSAVLTDIIMGAMSGVELADRLQEISPALPIIFMSGYVGASQLGGCKVLHKPFQLDELKEAVEAALRGKPNTSKRAG